MPYRPQLAALFVFLASVAPGADSGSPVDTIGYRHDGTGVFPADCTPVTTWNEMDFAKVPGKDRHGRDIQKEVPGEERRVNIVWKTPLANYCVGGMIVVGGQFYQLVDRGGIGYATDLVPDFVGPLLVCMDPASGEILWKRELHHLDQIEGVDPAEARETILGYCERHVEVYSVHSRIYGLINRINKGKELTEEQAARYSELAREYATYVPDFPLTVAEAKESKLIKGIKGYVQTSYWGVMKKYLDDQVARKKQAERWGYNWNAWFGNSSFVGSAMPTPVSDGESIWIATGYNDAFRVDLDGEVQWCNWYGPQGASWGAYITSPVIHDGVMITHHGTGQHKDLHYRGVDAASGKELWVCRYPPAKSYHMVTPTPLSLAIEGEEEPLHAIWTGAGNVIRVRDGKILAEGLGVHANARPHAFAGDVLVIRNGSSEGGHGQAKTFPEGLMAMRLVAKSRDEVVGELLWSAPKDDDARLVAHDGHVYGFCKRGAGGWAMRVRDLLTGEEVARVKMPPPPIIPQHLGAIAGHHLFALHGDGRCAIYDIGDPRAPEAVGVSRLGTKAYHREYGAFNQGGQPFFSGNRIFIRSYTDVYCVGDPDQAMRLSEAHR